MRLPKSRKLWSFGLWIHALACYGTLVVATSVDLLGATVFGCVVLGLALLACLVHDILFWPEGHREELPPEDSDQAPTS
jgi:hypothetical protein